MTLAQLTLIAILSLVHAPAVDIADHAEQHRLVTLSHDIALAAELHDGAPFVGAARKEALALALVAISFHESGFAEKIAACKVTGDRRPWNAEWDGKSVTMYQLHIGPSWDGEKREEICGNGALAAWLAARVLKLHGSRCMATPSRWFRGYASGSCGTSSHAATNICHSWERLARNAGLVGAQCWGRGAITRDAAPATGADR